MTRRGDGGEVLDADAAEAVTIEPRLDGDDVPFGEHGRRRRGGERFLVDVEADPVAGAVDEPVVVAGVAEHRTARLVEVRARNARTNGGEAGELRLQHKV